MTATIVISIILAALIALIILNMCVKKKHGSRGCGCSSCTMSDICRKASK